MVADRRPMARALERLALAYGHLEDWLSRVQGAGRQAAGAFFEQALSPAEQTRLGVRLYERSVSRRSPRVLFDWERDWLERRLPPPPARILIGAAGSGAEVLYLQAAGYHVDALEPAPALAAACRERLMPGQVVVSTYEELAAALLDGTTNAASWLATAEPYAAVLLGWASLSHVLRASERARLLQACDRLAPDGPILSSFWMTAFGVDGAPRTRAKRWGRWLGGAIARSRGLPDTADELTFSGGTGFGHRFVLDELEELAGVAGRRLRLESAPGQYPHASFLPRSRDGSER